MSLWCPGLQGGEGGTVLLLSSGEERTGKEGEGGVRAEGFRYGQSWTKEVKLGGIHRLG